MTVLYNICFQSLVAWFYIVHIYNTLAQTLGNVARVGCGKATKDDPQVDKEGSRRVASGPALESSVVSSGCSIMRSMSIKSMLPLPNCNALIASFLAISSSKVSIKS